MQQVGRARAWCNVRGTRYLRYPEIRPSFPETGTVLEESPVVSPLYNRLTHFAVISGMPSRLTWSRRKLQPKKTKTENRLYRLSAPCVYHLATRRPVLHKHILSIIGFHAMVSCCSARAWMWLCWPIHLVGR